ncbi:MAG: hypothetical protein JRF15_11195 [Deltaproteobacteria bacterium]|jgi:hypothetical protein|nr:hypothetical protein [Deltaproteobacteria bacterium]
MHTSLNEVPIDSSDPAHSIRALRSLPAGFRRALAGLAFSNGLPAAIGASVCLASSRALEAEPAGRFALVAACGAFVVYGLDRLRDTERDRTTSPLRTEFVLRHRLPLSVSLALAALILVAALCLIPREAAVLCVAVGGIGLLHRRLKGWAALKALYVSAAWVAICAGLPGIVVGFDARVGWLAGVLALAFGANLIASNVGDDESRWLRERPESALRVARAMAVLGVGVALSSPPELRALAWIPLAETLALLRFRQSEHYGELAVDGALLVGALTALIHQSLV